METEIISKYRECEDELLQGNLSPERKVYLTMAMQMYENQLLKNYKMDPSIYSQEGQEQYLDIRVKFKVVRSPNTKEHLTQVLRAYLQGKGALNDKHIEFEI